MTSHGKKPGHKQKGMDCDDSGSSQDDCKMKSGCQHLQDASLLVPLRPAVRMQITQLPVPGASGSLSATDVNLLAEGFSSPPLQPPRN